MFLMEKYHLTRTVCTFSGWRSSCICKAKFEREEVDIFYVEGVGKRVTAKQSVNEKEKECGNGVERLKLGEGKYREGKEEEESRKEMSPGS